MNWDFSTLKENIPNNEQLTDEEKSHILNIVSTIEAADYWKINE
jgi:hypothetical protein